MLEADVTKVVEEIGVRIRETQEDFILDTIFPYCQETLQRKINKAELKQIILRGSRPKGKWIDISVIKAFHYDGEPRVRCSRCGDEEEWSSNYCPNCGADMRGAEDET